MIEQRRMLWDIDFELAAFFCNRTRSRTPASFASALAEGAKILRTTVVEIEHFSIEFSVKTLRSLSLCGERKWKMENGAIIFADEHIAIHELFTPWRWRVSRKKFHEQRIAFGLRWQCHLCFQKNAERHFPLFQIKFQEKPFYDSYN